MKQWIAGQKGQQVIVVALLMPVLLACLGLVVDVGNVYAHRRKAQSAADAAATAASIVLYQQGPSVASSTALYYAALNGYDNDGTTNVVAVSSPPTSGTYAGNSNYLQVQIEDNVTPIFASIIWNGTFTVRAKATAGYRTVTLGPSVIILELVDCQSLLMNGTPQLVVHGGGVHVNSRCSSQAVLLNGTCTLQTDIPTTIVGGYRTNGPNQISPTPITGAAVRPDPLANLPVPTGAECPTYHNTVINGRNTVHLSPGIYEGGLTINGVNTVYFDTGSGACAGTYIMRGGAFIDNGNSRLYGSNVFFYIDTGSRVTINGTSTVNFSPPTTGAYAGILFFQSRTNTSGATLNGTPGVDGFNGVLYFAEATVTMNGTGRAYVSLVINKLLMNGTGSLIIEGFSGPGWSTVSSTLAE